MISNEQQPTFNYTTSQKQQEKAVEDPNNLN